MFDTVHLRANHIQIAPNVLQQYESQSVTFNKNGVAATKYTIYDEIIPRIVYHNGSYTLKIEVSIPKMLYSNNIALVTEEDVTVFFAVIRKRMKTLFQIEMTKQEWSVIRSDVSWNFNVGLAVSDYLHHFGKQKMPFKNTIQYNQESVVYSNKSSRMMLYNKHKQCVKDREPAAVIEQSKGILRLEIRPSYHEMKQFSSTKKAVDLLTKQFFNYVMGKALQGLTYPQEFQEIEYGWLLQNKERITEIERYLGFQKLRGMFDESTLKEMYPPSTYALRKSMAKKMTIPKGNCLNALSINF